MMARKLMRISGLLVLAVIIILNTALVSADTGYRYYDEALKLYNLGLYQGMSSEYFEPGLDKTLNREEALTMALRIFADEKTIAGLTNQEISPVLQNIKDSDQISEWAKRYIAFAYINKIISLDLSGRFNPKGTATTNEYCSWIVKLLGYEVDQDVSPLVKLVEAGGLTPVQMLQMNGKELTRDDFAGITYNSLNALQSDGKTVISWLVKNGKVLENKAMALGFLVEDKLYETLADLVAQLEFLIDKGLNSDENILSAKKLLDEALDISSKLKKNDFILNLKLAEYAINRAKESHGLNKELQTKLELSVKTLEQLASNELILKYNIKTVEDALEEAKKALAAVKESERYEEFADKINEIENKIKDSKILDQVEQLVKDFESFKIVNTSQFEDAKELKKQAEAMVQQLNNVEIKEALMLRIEEKSKAIQDMEQVMTPGEVLSVTAPNLKQLIIEFSKPIYEESINLRTLKISEEIGYRAFSEDGKVLTLHFYERLPQNSIISVEIDGIRDIDGHVIPAYKTEVVAMDTTPPEVEEVIFVHNQLIKLKLSEPFDFNSRNIYELSNPEALNGVSIKIDNEYAYVRVKANETEKTMSLEFINPLKDGEHTIEVSGIKDWAGFRSNTFTGKFTSFTDKKPPELVDVTVENTERIHLTFDEPVYLLPSNVRITELSGLYKFISNIKIDGAKVTITLGDPLTAGSFNGFKITLLNIRDDFGNTRDFEIGAKLHDDTDAPEIERYIVTNLNTLKLIFNEAVDVSNILLTLVDAEGNTIKREDAGMSIRALNDSLREYEVFIQYIRDKKPSRYTLLISGVVDKSVRKNPMKARGITFVSNDEYKPVIIRASKSTDIDSGKDIIEIIFSESMELSVLKDLSRYIVKGVGMSQPKSLDYIQDCEIVSITNDGKKVVIAAPRNSFYGYDYITILNLRDVNGKPLWGPGSNMGNYYEMK